ncbi:MAG: DUF2017 domain-containing protein [Acidimicrobiales bacterium]|nr:MAG: DUF2017 domain-containing protein [Acidimicrobiales bacterium]
MVVPTVFRGFHRRHQDTFTTAQPGAAAESSTQSGVEYVAEVASLEADAMRQVFQQVLELLEGGSIRSDPALRRLFPDGYRDDQAAANELRRFSEAALRTGKLAACRQVLADLPTGQGQIRLSAAQAQTWLISLTDARLVLGIRLDINSQTDVLAQLTEDCERERPQQARLLLAMYQHLTYLQESLLEALSHREGSTDTGDV